MARSSARRHAAFSLFTVCATASAVLSVGAPAHASGPTNDAIVDAVQIDLSGDTASFFASPSDAGATADDSSADGALSGSQGSAQHTLWYRFDPKPGLVSVTVKSSDVAKVVAGVVTTTSPNPVDGTLDEFDLINSGSVKNSDSAESGESLAVTPALNVPETFSFSDDRQFVPDAHHSYYLGIASIGTNVSAPTGAISIRLSYTKAPLNDDFANATPLTTTQRRYTGDTTAATPELDAKGDNVDPYLGQASMFSVWYRFTAPHNGLATISTAGSSFPVEYDVCRSSVPSAANCAKAHNTIDDSTGSRKPMTETSFDAVQGESYYLFLDGEKVSGQAYNASGPYDLGFGFVAGPADDDISTPTALRPTGVDRVTGTNVGAQAVSLGANPPTSITTEASHGLSFNHGAEHTVWFSYTPKQTGARVIDTTGLLDTDVEVFRGALASGFTDTLAGNDDYAGFANSRLVLRVKAGTRYVIGVDGSHRSGYPEGSFGLDLGAPPANDNLEHAKFLARHRSVSKRSGTVTGSTEFATFQAREKHLKHGVGGADVWYTFVAPAGGKYRFTDTGTAGFLAAYSGKGSDNLGLRLVSESTPSFATTTTLSVHAKKGQKFELSVDSVTGYAGKYRLRWK